MPSPRNLSLNQNPGWNKTAVDSLGKGAVLDIQLKASPKKLYLLDDMTEQAVFERMRKTGGALGLYPELEGFMDSLNGQNKLQETRFLDFYDCGPWEYE